MTDIKITNGHLTKVSPVRLVKMLAYAEMILTGHAVTQRELHDIHEGQLQKYVERSLDIELSPEAAKRTKERVAYVNVLQMVVSKLSRTYSRVTTRTSLNPLDKELMEIDSESMDLNNNLLRANQIRRLQRRVLLEPYINSKGAFELRALPAQSYVCFSDNQVNPLCPEAVIKFMPPQASLNNDLRIPGSPPRLVNIFWIYTATELIIIDSEGGIRSSQPNALGRLPFVYSNASKSELTPAADVESIKNAVLIPKLLGDVAYGLQYCSHSIAYGIDIDPTDLKGNPDSFWIINSVPGDNKKPEIGVLKPEVNVAGSLSFVSSIVDMWLLTKGIKSQGIGTLTPSTAASGISKAIDQADTTHCLEEDEKTFRSIEDELWELIALMRKTYRLSLADQRQMTEDPDFAIKFSDPAPLVDKLSELKELQLKLQLGLTSQKRALKLANPELSDAELEVLFKEIADEKAAVVAAAQAAIAAGAPDAGGAPVITEKQPKDDSAVV